VKTSVAIAFARGVPIVTSDWLAHCASHGYEEPSAEFASRDACFEQRYGVDLKDMSGRVTLLMKYAVLVKPGYRLEEKVRYKAAAECSGAIWISAAPLKPADRTLLIIDAVCSFDDSNLHIHPNDFLLAILRGEDPARRVRHRIAAAPVAAAKSVAAAETVAAVEGVSLQASNEAVVAALPAAERDRFGSLWVNSNNWPCIVMDPRRIPSVTAAAAAFSKNPPPMSDLVLYVGEKPRWAFGSERRRRLLPFAPDLPPKKLPASRSGDFRAASASAVGLVGLTNAARLDAALNAADVPRVDAMDEEENGDAALPEVEDVVEAQPAAVGDPMGALRASEAVVACMQAEAARQGLIIDQRNSLISAARRLLARDDDSEL
jgi:hypothetical protein